MTSLVAERGESDGAVYRIGELAVLANISKRTVDYYTNLGLLQPKRSSSNYRYYDEYDLEILQMIEQCKSLHMPLCKIKELVKNKREAPNAEQLLGLTRDVNQRMQQLEQEMSLLTSQINSLSEEEQHEIRQKLSVQGTTLLHSLLLLLPYKQEKN
ncbi:MerR family transcriptional regulator [Brevibacillus laterosporus]|nr:MerR family transcriptional regulator [Brevibacillus laterosporus]ATO51689.1 MerR family transcriptional regulator [Brevibacillus laterosporus DSM 25]AYB41501.1 MerR family transcriptional regulator [Brevibacillus laterosporus]MBG9798694.1 MerR family transcriptional regulator [Brevibacillus laterosporus]MBG9803981.1 MerR family transcriptional regulator [Brevibacillus laterosporus]MED1910429.1 MerR family transcriptional regulator [Brevibacillus laterosporus]